MSLEKRKLLWRCRRGMVELDLILMSFVKQRYDQLERHQQQLFQEVLEIEDPTLYGWVMGHEDLTDNKYNEIVELIKANPI